MLFAHERWFEFESVSSDWGFITETATLLLLIGAGAITLRAANRPARRARRAR